MSTLLAGPASAAGHLPPFSESMHPRLFGSLAPLFALSFLLYCARIYTRVRSHRALGLDDYAISVAMVLTTVNLAFLFAAQVATGGRHTIYISREAMSKALPLSFFTLPLWVWSVTWTKASVLFMLLRIEKTPRWRRQVWSLITFVFAIAVAMTFCQFLQCRPVRANWDLAIPRTCWSPRKILHITYAVSSLFITTDVACAVLPLHFICNIKRPMRERVVVAVLMALGLFASACGMVKLALLEPAMISKDPWWDSTSLTIWSYAEEYIGIATACIPCLRSLLEHVFRGLGGRINSVLPTLNSGTQTLQQVSSSTGRMEIVQNPQLISDIPSSETRDIVKEVKITWTEVRG